MAQVQVIQPYQPQSDTLEKVAAYCRVSTDSKDQLMYLECYQLRILTMMVV